MNHLYFYRIMSLEKKLGSTKDPIFTFRFFDTKSKTEFTNISAKTKKIWKYFGVLILVLGTFDLWKKPELKNLMLLSLYVIIPGEKTTVQKFPATVPLTISLSPTLLHIPAAGLHNREFLYYNI